MGQLAAQVSLYPLGQDDLSPAINEVLATFDRPGLHAETGPMSTILSGDDGPLFAALHRAALTADRRGRMVMVVTISNACAVQAPGSE